MTLCTCFFDWTDDPDQLPRWQRWPDRDCIVHRSTDRKA